MSNKLHQYYRTFKSYIRLPSGNSFYPPNVVEYTDSGELGVYAMTGKDEVLIKNPDALVNGEGLKEVIKSCVPGIKDVNKLLINDIHMICVAIKAASYGNTIDISSTCPHCNHKNLYGIDLLNVINTSTYLEDQYVVNLDNGLSIFIRPYDFSDNMTVAKTALEQAKFIRIMQSDMYSDEEKLSAFSNTINELSSLNFELIAKTIVRIVDETNGIDIVNNTPQTLADIKEFIANIDRADVNKIDSLLKEINQVGVNGDFDAVCDNCNKSFVVPVDFNPVSFFRES